jgi:hypothetical protein
MKTIAKLATGAILACGLTAAATAPAAAAVRFNIGIGAPVVAAPSPYSCYDAYGNYAYSTPYCTAYTAPYVAPQVQFTFGDRDRDRGAFHDRDRGPQAGRSDQHDVRGGRGHDRD